jgi:hypothetical protein
MKKNHPGIYVLLLLLLSLSGCTHWSATPQPTPEIDPIHLVNEELDRLTTGVIFYNPPKDMTVAQQERIDVRISSNTLFTSTEGFKGSGAVQTETLPVATFMKVNLRGECFDITALSSEEQVIPADSHADWAWDVTPTEKGLQTLSLVVTARIKLPGYSDEQKDLQVIERDINVRVNPAYALRTFFDKNRDWVYPVVVIPLVLGAWGFLQQRYTNYKAQHAPPQTEKHGAKTEGAPQQD